MFFDLKKALIEREDFCRSPGFGGGELTLRMSQDLVEMARHQINVRSGGGICKPLDRNKVPLLSSATTEVRTESALRPLLKASTRLWLMNVLILAAGYATRLYPLTLNKAKPLLEIAGKPMIERIVENLKGVPEVKTIYIVTNSKFAADFQTWASGYEARETQFTFKIVNDGSTSDDDKLGAIGDINLALTRENLTSDDLLIIAGDNLFSESLTGFVEFARGQ